jgi:CDP-diacylglycerol--glycerol-3-phosphate 3-phosphatidyltransferase
MGTTGAKGAIKQRLRGILDPVVALLDRLGATPTGVTVAGLALSLAGAIEVGRGAFVAGGLVLIAAGVCDTLDGSLARRRGAESPFGAFLDSTIDRVAELACFGALIVYYGSHAGRGPFTVPLLIAGLGGSFLTSYTRARAEGLGLECRVGVLERPERVALLVLGLLIGGIVLYAVIVCLAVLTIATTVQRIVHVHRLTSPRGRAR